MKWVQSHNVRQIGQRLERNRRNGSRVKRPVHVDAARCVQLRGEAWSRATHAVAGGAGRP